MEGITIPLEEAIDRLLEERSRIAQALAVLRAFGLADEAAAAEVRLRAVNRELHAVWAALRAGGGA